MEIATSAKRQALESSTGSPKASSPKRLVSLSRESSLKSMDKGKMKSGQQIPLRNHLGGDDVDLSRSVLTGPRSQNQRSMIIFDIYRTSIQYSTLFSLFLISGP